MNKYIEEADDFAQLLGTSMEKASLKLNEIGYDHLVWMLAKEETARLCDFYFAIVSLHHPSVNRILEVGTGSGRTTILFAELFPEATIWSFDIPEEDPDFNRLAKPQRKNLHIKDRFLDYDKLLYFEINSFFLNSERFLPDNFDLIFIDGGHDYPSIAWDLSYAYGHLAEDGFLFIHDYGNRGDVKHAVDYIAERIPEKIHYLPSTSAETIKAKTPCIWKGHI